MNTPKNDGGPAFPIPYGQVMTKEGMGMSLRDYFAAKAMQGWLATYAENPHPGERPEYTKKIAKMSYVIADAMLKAREQ